VETQTQADSLSAQLRPHFSWYDAVYTVMPLSSNEFLKDTILAAARAAGFELAGIAPVGDFAEHQHFEDWIAAGRAAEMQYMESRDDAGRLKRSSLGRVAPWARSVIVCAANYNTANPYSTSTHNPAQGWIARYAWSREDYHDSVLRKLRAVEEALLSAIQSGTGAEHSGLTTRCYVDTGPVAERIYAKYAGIGWSGKNTCLINQKTGSWLFLGVILTSLALTPDMPAADRCGSCTRCIDACPTHAIIAPYQLDANLCISYLTIEKRGPIPEPIREGLGRHVFGCDICQDVCPWNRKAPVTSAAEYQPRDGLVNPALEWLAAMDEVEFRKVFRGSPIRRAKRQGLRRNAALAMGNSGNPEFLPVLQTMERDEDSIVADAAQWAVLKLKNSPVLGSKNYD
jgi:epoxyqueuosine reductase